VISLNILAAPTAIIATGFLLRRYELHKAMAHHDGHLPDHAIAAHGPDGHPGERAGGTQMNHAALARRLLLPGYRQRTRTIVAWIRARERHTLRLQLEGRAGGVHLGYPFTRTLGGSRSATLCSATLLCTRRETTSSISVHPAGYHATSTESAPHIAGPYALHPDLFILAQPGGVVVPR
jgi:hypothetical protein